MPDSQRLALSKYRLERAKETYLTALENLNNGKYLDANNRAYYCIFHSIRAVLALDGVDFKKHSGVISYFREKYVKTNVFTAVFSDIIGKATMIRNKSDYEDFYTTSHDEAQEQVKNALLFYEKVESYISGCPEKK